MFARHLDENPMVVPSSSAARARSGSSATGGRGHFGGALAAPSVAWQRCGAGTSGSQGPLDPAHGGSAMLYGGGRLQAYDTKRR